MIFVIQDSYVRVGLSSRNIFIFLVVEKHIVDCENSKNSWQELCVVMTWQSMGKRCQEKNFIKKYWSSWTKLYYAELVWMLVVIARRLTNHMSGHKQEFSLNEWILINYIIERRINMYLCQHI